MGVFSNLFKKKQNDIQQNVIDENYLVSNDGSQSNVEGTDFLDGVSNESTMIVVEQSNVLEQMQNNFVIESARELEEKSIEDDPMSVFNQNITLDSSNPMSIFGTDTEDNKQ